MSGEQAAAATTLASPRAADEALTGDALRAKKLFERWQKTFLGAIDKQSEDYIISMLREGEDLIASGLLDLNRSIKPASGSTFLHTVAWFQKKRVLEWLLAHGADPNLGNIKGNSPTHLLCEQANKDIAPQLIQCMIDYGADVFQADNTGADSVAKAKAVGFDVMQLNFERGKQFKAARDAERNGTHNTESLGGSGKADTPGGQNGDGRDDGVPADLPPLSEADRAAGADKAKMVYRKLSTLFLGLEAQGVSKAVDDAIVRILTSNMHLIHHKLLDLNLPIADAGGKTFLHLAVCARRSEIVRVLLVGRADPNKGDENGDTALHHAMPLLDEENGPAIIAQLLDAGASKTKTNYLRGLNALQSLPENVSPEAKQWLQEYQPKLSKRMSASAFASKLQLSASGGSSGGGNVSASPTHAHGRSGGSIGNLPPSPAHAVEKQDRAGARALMARLASNVHAGNAASLAGSGAEGVLNSPKNPSGALGLIQGSRASTTAATTNARGSMGGNLFGGALASILSRNNAAAAGGAAGSGGGGAGSGAVGVLASAVARARGGATATASTSKSGVGVGGKKSVASKASERHLQLDELFRVLDISEIHVLTLAQVSALHQSFHAGCEGCPQWIVQQVMDCAIPAGCCTRANILDILSQLTLQCSAQSKLAWDVALLDPDGMGALSTQETAGATGAVASSAELVWASNQGDNATKYEESDKTTTAATRAQEPHLLLCLSPLFCCVCFVGSWLASSAPSVRARRRSSSAICNKNCSGK